MSRIFRNRLFASLSVSFAAHFRLIAAHFRLIAAHDHEPYFFCIPAACERNEPPPDLWLSASHEPLISQGEWEPERSYQRGGRTVSVEAFEGRKANVVNEASSQADGKRDPELVERGARADWRK